jgi:Xaa-Pro dipeptidase
MMRTLAVGEATGSQRHLFSAVREALEEMTEALAPGRPVDDAHRRVLAAAGLENHRFAACGYSLGTTFSPNWMD